LEKAVLLLQQVTVLGYLVDSVQMTVSIPLEKISTVITLCNDFVTRKSASLYQLQVLIENLIFVACVVCSGWIFMSRMLPLLKARVVLLTSLFF
jgi:hypothetical protein